MNIAVMSIAIIIVSGLSLAALQDIKHRSLNLRQRCSGIHPNTTLGISSAVNRQ